MRRLGKRQVVLRNRDLPPGARSTRRKSILRIKPEGSSTHPSAGLSVFRGRMSRCVVADRLWMARRAHCASNCPIVSSVQGATFVRFRPEADGIAATSHVWLGDQASSG